MPSARAAPTTPRSAPGWARPRSTEDLFFDLAIEDLTRAADLFRPIHDRTNGVDGWVSLEVSPLLAYDTKSTLAMAKDLHAPRRQAEPFDQDPRHQGGPAGDRGGDFRRHPDQRDAAVLARALRGGGAGLSSRHRAAHRGRARPLCRLGRLDLHQPLGRRGEGRGAGRPARQARHRGRDARLQGLSRAARLARLAAQLQSRRPPAAPALGEHRHQGSPRPRHSLRQVAGLAVHRQHHARGHAEGVRRPRRRSATSCRRTAATARRCWPGSPRLASTSMRSQPSCRTRAPSRSSAPGPT